MAVALKLDFNPTAYQNLSVLYLNELLAAYKKWSTHTYNVLRPGGDKDSERADPDWSPHIFDRKPVDAHRREIQAGYENYRAGILQAPGYIPFDWYDILVEDGFIEYDPDATLRENKRASQLTEVDKRRLSNGQMMVWELFKTAHLRNIFPIYVRM